MCGVWWRGRRREDGGGRREIGEACVCVGREGGGEEGRGGEGDFLSVSTLARSNRPNFLTFQLLPGFVISFSFHCFCFQFRVFGFHLCSIFFKLWPSQRNEMKLNLTKLNKIKWVHISKSRITLKITAHTRLKCSNCWTVHASRVMTRALRLREHSRGFKPEPSSSQLKTRALSSPWTSSLR